MWTQEKVTVTHGDRQQSIERSRILVHLVLFQEPQLDGDVISHPLVLLAVRLEQLLGLLDLGQGVGVAWSKVQLLQISAVSIVLNPVRVSETATGMSSSVLGDTDRDEAVLNPFSTSVGGSSAKEIRKWLLHVCFNVNLGWLVAHLPRSHFILNTQVSVYFIPGKLILLNIKHGVFNRFVHQRVHAGDEEVDGTEQRLSIFGQELLGVSIVAKLILKAKM